MTTHARLHRAFYDARSATPRRADIIHQSDCRCPECAAFEPASRPIERALTFVDFGWLALAGAAVGSAIAFSIDPHGAWHALASCFGGL